ncbi:MAG: alpha-L-arabinofuranosidase C-terminal domain-containing protein [Promethearchaeota archaeon]
MSDINYFLRVPKNTKIASKNLLGHFIEHVGKCIHGGLWTPENRQVKSLFLKDKGLERVRKDVFDAISALRPPILRWPGGCFSDTYHWMDGIGPRHARPKRRNQAWGGIKNFREKIGPKEDNHFGTEEFLLICEKLNAEAYININYGTGTPEEAAAWVEYTNLAGSGKKFSRMRQENGRKRPYRVKYWGIGNEIYGFWEKGHEKNGRDYAEKYLKFARSMKKVDPSIQLIAVGWGSSSEWNRDVLKKAGKYINLLSVHLYFGPRSFIPFVFRRGPLPQDIKMFRIMVNASLSFESLIESTRKDIVETLGTSGIKNCKIALDEWNSWHRFSQLYRADRPHYTLADGLLAALILNVLIRNADVVKMANFAQLINCLGMILVYDDKIVYSPQYHVFKLYSIAWEPRVLMIESKNENDERIESSWYNKDFPERVAPVVDLAAMSSHDKKSLSIFCINRHESDSKKVSIDFEDIIEDNAVDMKKSRVFVLTHENPFGCNTHGSPDNVRPREGKMEINNSRLLLNLPAKSLVVVIMKFH